MDAKISPNFRGAGVVSGVSSRIGGSERNKSVTRPRTAIYKNRKEKMFHYSHVGKKKRLAFEAVTAKQLEEDRVE